MRAIVSRKYTKEKREEVNGQIKCIILLDTLQIKF